MSGAANDSYLLEDYVDREQRHLDALKAVGGSWIARWRQARRVSRALEALQWSDTRGMGEDAFIQQHGLLRSGVWVGVSAAVGWFVLMGVGSVREVLVGVLVGATCGVVSGFFSGMMEWERAEERFARTLADVSARADNRLTSG
jgi:hypothetical protein